MTEIRKRKLIRKIKYNLQAAGGCLMALGFILGVMWLAEMLIRWF